MVVPVPAACVKLAAVTLPLKVAFCALLIISAPKRVLPPTAPVKVRLPVPAVMARFSWPEVVPLRVLLNKMLPAAAPVLMATGPVSVVADT